MSARFFGPRNAGAPAKRGEASCEALDSEAGRAVRAEVVADLAAAVPEIGLDAAGAIAVSVLGPLTLAECGVLAGTSKQRAHQVEAGALAKLRRACLRRGVASPDEALEPARSSGSAVRPRFGTGPGGTRRR